MHLLEKLMRLQGEEPGEVAGSEGFCVRLASSRRQNAPSAQESFVLLSSRGGLVADEIVSPWEFPSLIPSISLAMIS